MEDKSEYIFANWRTIERRAITNLLNAYQAYPDTLKPICKTIMNNWQTEIEQKIFQVYGESHKGDHIRISLGHPSLKSLAKKTAEEIVKTKKENSVTIPDYLFEIAEKIVNEAIYPDWKLNNNENE
ncbi:MAG: hypothetical protein IPH11_17760 [Ignavibacteriales bacterium]|nr:hypothetical protein [Ignavibacteriales bacterium]